MSSATGAVSRYAGLARRALEVRLGSTRPFKAIVSLTDRCDCRCEACLIWRKPKSTELTAAELETAFAAAPWIRWLNLTGGEPFLREDLVEVVEACVRALPRLAVLDFPTTGQRTERILEGVAQRLGMPMSRFHINIDRYGNTSAASVPIALDEAVRAGKVKEGMTLLFCALGAGYAWGSAAVRW